MATGTIKDFQHAPIMEADEGGPTRAEENWTSAEHETGVAYIAPWEDPYAGFPEHARRCARALNDAMGDDGWPVHLRSYDPTIQWHMHFEVGGKDKIRLRKQYDDLLTQSVKNYAVSVYQVVPSESVLQHITTHPHMTPFEVAFYNRFKIISTVFERDRVSEHTVKCLNRVGQVWVASRKDVDMLKREGVERVARVPIPHFPDDPLIQFRAQPRRPGVTRFYHIGKWEPRKAHHEMIGAFLLAFKPGEAKLYFKTSTKAPDYGSYEPKSSSLEESVRDGFRVLRGGYRMPPTYPNSPEESVHFWMNDPEVKANGWTVEKTNANIFFIRRRVSDAQIKQLHSMGDVYLSLSRGEGFDMPAYDAKIAGNRMIFTPSGGPQDFASDIDERVAASGLVRCHPFYRWGDACYLNWEYGDAVESLRRINRQVQSDPGADKLPEGRYVSPGFLAPAVGAHMRRLVEQVAKESGEWAEEANRRAREEAEASGELKDES